MLINGLAVYITSLLIPGVFLRDFLTALIVSVLMGVCNALIKPLLIILTLPVTIFTLGLFIFIINGLLVMLVGSIVPGFYVDNLFSGILFGIILSVVSWFLNSLKEEKR